MFVGDEEQSSAGSGADDGRANACVNPGEATCCAERCCGLKSGFERVEGVQGEVDGGAGEGAREEGSGEGGDGEGRGHDRGLRYCKLKNAGSLKRRPQPPNALSSEMHFLLMTIFRSLVNNFLGPACAS